jgi:hypothetical protein
MPNPTALGQAPPYLNLMDNISVHPFSPECLGRDWLAISVGLGSAVWTANLLIFIPLLLAQPTLVAQFWWMNGAAVNGNTDVGVYTEDGQTKLGGTGSTLNSGTSQIQVVDVADFRLAADTRYWLALGSDSGTQAYSRNNLIVGGLDYIGVKQQAAGWSSGLPTTVTPAAPTVAILPNFGFTGKATI